MDPSRIIIAARPLEAIRHAGKVAPHSPAKTGVLFNVSTLGELR